MFTFMSHGKSDSFNNLSGITANNMFELGSKRLAKKLPNTESVTEYRWGVFYGQQAVE